VALLVRVVQTRSFSAAARERGVPVSTVSRRISRLESALGTRLLERTTRSLRLTDAGRAYFDHAARAMDDLAQGTVQLNERQAEPKGRVRVRAPMWLSGAISNVVHDYLARYPGASVDLELDQRASNLSAEGFDVAIVPGALADTGDFVAREIWKADPKLLFVSPGYVKSRGIPRGASDLTTHALIATRSRDGFETWTLLSGSRKHRITFAPRFYVSEVVAARRAALAGVGIALLPHLLCVEDLAKKRLVHVLPNWKGETGGVHLLYRSGRSLSVAARALIERLLADLPSLDPRLLLK
jgi:DNA-binding transcriptional LysR family regulator